MIQILVLAIAISLASGQTFQQIQSFPAQNTQQVVKHPEVQPEVDIQAQQRASELNDETSRKFRQSIAQSIRDRQNANGGSPVDSLNDPNIVEINNQPLRRSNPRLRKRVRVAERLDVEEPENVPQAFVRQSTAPVESRKQFVQFDDEEDIETAKYLRKQAESAHYSFGSSVHDTINDQAISRQEVREGLALKGMYSYSDGFFKRTVHYEADENGYRVTKEEIDPIGEGPQYNPKGRADVSSSLSGDYSITAADVRDTRVKNPLQRGEPLIEPQIEHAAPERVHRFGAGRV